MKIEMNSNFPAFLFCSWLLQPINGQIASSFLQQRYSSLVDTYIQKEQKPLKCTMYIYHLYRNLSMPPFPKAKVCKHYISEHSLLGSGSGKQNIRHSPKKYFFRKLFIYRIIITIHNGASWVLPISDFFKLLYSKKGKFSLFFFISKLIEK